MPDISSIEMRRLSYSLGSLLTIEEVLDCSQKLNDVKPEAMWIPETWGMENFSMLSLASKQNKFSKIGSSIINIYSRSPSLIAMGAATIDTISNGRLILGLGTSSVPIIQDFHGQTFESPIQRMKEYVEIIRVALSGKKINYSGEIFSLKDFTLLVDPVRKEIPIYLAAINRKMVELTWNIADGVIFYLRPKDEMKKTISNMQEIRKIDTSLQIITCIDHDYEKAINRAKKTLSFYIAVGTIYRDFLHSNGYLEETEIIYNEYKKRGLENLEKLVPDKMLDDLCIAGTPDIAVKKLNAFYDIGIDIPIIQFNPIGDVKESFQLLTNTFSGEINE
jgi:alkanesulfonate monooxygenase SsuD/methylene tetrahydromethanopterin reductase-like flavin-dependent oxidoreductase (luciferase family)